MTEFVALALGYILGWFAGRSHGRRSAAVRAAREASMPATDRQRQYLASLASRSGGGDVLASMGISDPWSPDLTTERASAAIDRLKGES